MDASIVVRLIDETKQGFSDIQRNLSSVDDSGKNLTRTMGALETAAAAFVGALASKRLLDFVDSVQTMDNRLKLVEKSQTDVNIRFNELFDVAQRTRAPIQETVDLFSKLAQNQSVVGKTGSEVTKVVEAFTTAMAISGTSGIAASGAITQFAQAMQSGKLQGDEFRSMAEAVPKILEILSKKTGIAREDLKKLASDGFLNAKIVAQALTESLPDLQQELNLTSKTVRGAITNMTNEFVKLGRSFLETSGTSSALVKAIDHITDNAENLIPIIKVVGAVLVGLAAFFAPVTAAVVLTSVAVVAFANHLGPIAKVIVDTFGKAIDYVMPKISGIGSALIALMKFEDPFAAYSNTMKKFQTEAQKSTVETDKLSGATGKLTNDQKANAGPSAEMIKLMKENGLQQALAGQEMFKFNAKLKEQISLAGLDSDAKQRQTLINEGLSAKAKDLKKSVEELTEAQKKDVVVTVDAAMVKISSQNNEMENRKRIFKEGTDLLNKFAEASRSNQNTTLSATQRFSKDLLDIETAYQNAMLNSKGKSAEEMKRIEQDYQAAMRGIHTRGLTDLFTEYRKYTETTLSKNEQFNLEKSKIEEAFRISQLDRNNQSFAQQTELFNQYQTTLQGLQMKFGAEYKQAAQDFRTEELTGEQKYFATLSELNRAYYEYGIISNADYNTLLAKANKQFVDTTVQDYGHLYGALNEKLLSWSGLSQKEYGIVKDTFKLVFGVDVDQLVKQFFAEAIKYVLGFRSAATGDLNGVGGVISGIFGTGGTGQSSFTGFAAMAGTIFTGLKTGATTIFSGIGSFISSVFSTSSPLGAVVMNFGSGFTAVFRSIASSAGTIFSDMGSFLGRIFSNLGQGLISSFGSIASFLSTNVLSTLNSIISGASSAVSALARVVGGGGGGGFISTAVSVVSSIFSFFSDRRMKENMQYKQTLANGINLYDFNYKSQYGLGTAPKTGVIAQEVQQQYPNAVSMNRNGMLQVDYDQLPISRSLLKLAKGGIVDSPTLLGSRSLAGEQGAEAVLPLNRGSGGELGVSVSGMGVVNVNFTINAVDAAGIDQLLLNRKQLITNLVRSAVADRGSAGRTFAF